MSNDPKYSRDYIQALSERIRKLPKENYRVIFNMITKDRKTQYVSAEATVYINMSAISDATMDDIVAYLGTIKHKKRRVVTRKAPAPEEAKLDQYSNYEKALMRDRTLKNRMNNQSEYKDFTFANLMKKK